jgi:hypothetical protein
MAYSEALAASARRHLAAADQLDDANPPRRCRDVAGYLYGVAAECALKQIMRESAIRPLPEAQRRDDPYYAHFPELKTLLLDAVSGRRAGDLRKFAESTRLMGDWSIKMRYAPAKEVLSRFVDLWRGQAHELVDAMEAR